MTSINVGVNHRRLRQVTNIGTDGSLDNLLFQARQTSNITLVQFAPYIAVPLDTVDFGSFEFELDSSNTERISVLQTGTYLVTYQLNASPPIVADFDYSFVSGRLSVDDVPIGGSDMDKPCFDFGITFPPPAPAAVTSSLYITANSGSYITVEAQTDNTAVLVDTQINITRAEGTAGPTGNAGSQIWIGPWLANTSYTVNNVVSEGGNAYVAIADSSGSQPPSASWGLLGQQGLKGANWQGEWTAIDFVLRDVVIFQGSAYICIENTTAAQDPTNTTFWSLLTQKADAAASPNLAHFFDAYHLGGVILTPTGTYLNIPMDTQRFIDTDSFSHTTGNAEVTIEVTGRYIVFAHMSTDVTAGAARSTSQMKLQINTGGGFADLLGAQGFMYNRISTAGKDSCDATIMLNISAGDRIKMLAQRLAGTDTVVSANTCSLSIVRVESFVKNKDTRARIFDDFYGDAVDNIWTIDTLGGGSTISPIDAVGGKLRLTSDSTIGNFAELRMDPNTVTMAANAVFDTRLALGSTSNTNVAFGIQSDITESIEFRYDTSLPNIEGITISGGTSTRTDTGIAADTSTHLYNITTITGNATFFIDGVSVVTNTTNLPVGSLHPFIRQESPEAFVRNCEVDFVEVCVNRV